MRFAHRLSRRRLRVDFNEDPFSMLVNFFDCSIVFALGFIVALLARPATDDAQAKGREGDARENGGTEQVAAERKRDRLRATSDTASGEGVRLGTAYRLANGDVVYVPDAAAKPR